MMGRLAGLWAGLWLTVRPGLAAGLLLALAGCSTISESSFNPLNWFAAASVNKPTELTSLVKPTLTFTRLWSASVGSAGAYVFTPAVVGDTVYAAGAGGNLAAFDALTGKQRWRVRADRDGLSAGVGASDTLVVVVTLRGEILAFDTKGRERWRTQVSSAVLAPPLVVENVVLVRSDDNRVFAFNAVDGKRLWVYQRTAPALVLRNIGGMIAAPGGQVYVGFPGGKLVALGLSNGTVRWEATVALSKGTTELERIADISSSPVLSGREVCAVAFQGRAACFEASNGQAIWGRDISSAAGLALDERFMFVSDDKSAVVALARGTGANLWKQERLLYRQVSGPVSVGRAVVVGDFEGVLHALSREDGSFIGRQSTGGGAIMTAPQLFSVPDKDAILVQTQKGDLFVFTL
ncbi:MAG TPA: outer membrane protein assembly factor BamB [Burkholderiales bacterium]|nr:outer membrane protein assembly factor BamB [Burkholderiales bacterium]